MKRREETRNFLKKGLFKRSILRYNQIVTEISAVCFQQRTEWDVLSMEGNEAGDMTCKNCGAPLDEGTRSCSRCGAAVLRQPSREEIRARVQGGGRHAAPPSTPARASGSGTAYAPATLGAQHTPLLCLVAGLLGILQIVYLFVNTLFVTIASGQTDFGVMRYSLYGALRQQGSTGLGVVLVLLCLVGLGSIAVPMILSGRPRSMITAGVSLLLLVFYVIALIKVRGAFSENFLGAKPKLGFYGWLFLLNCFLIPALVYLAAQVEDIMPAPARSPAPAPASAELGRRIMEKRNANYKH